MKLKKYKLGDLCTFVNGVHTYSQNCKIMENIRLLELVIYQVATTLGIILIWN